MADATQPSWIVRIPTPIWLIGLIVVAVLADRAFELPAVLRYRPGGIVLVIAGVAFSAWAWFTFRRHRAEIHPWSEAHSSLVTTGPFRFTRNPMYLGGIIAGIGAALIAGTWAMWLVPVVVFLLDNFVIIPFEERSMERAFGEAYRAYRARVRRWL